MAAAGVVHPEKRPSALSYRGRSDRWRWVDGAVQLEAVGRGPELFLDIDYYPELEDWLPVFFSPDRATSMEPVIIALDDPMRVDRAAP